MTVMESSKAAVDDLMTHIATVLKTTPEDAPLTRYLIISNEVDAPLLGYMRSQVREVASKRPSNREPGRIAVIYDGLLGGLINTMLRFTLNNELRFFKPQERTAAISWLNQGIV